MQNLLDGDHRGATPAPSGATEGILEDPNLLAPSASPIARFGRELAPPEKRKLDDITWWFFRLEFLEWRTTAAARELFFHQRTVAELLRPNYYLLNGVHRPAWHLRPGIDQVELAFVPWPPVDLSPTALMMRLVRSVRG
jgi:hypothetical protein